MTIYLGADHRGFALKEKIKQMLVDEVYSVVDCGATELAPDDDYTDYAVALAREMIKNPDEDRGILVCGSGFGVDITANKFRSIRAVLPSSPDHVYAARHDDNANVLALSADFLDEEIAIKIVRTFLSTPFGRDERYLRRLDKMADLGSG